MHPSKTVSKEAKPLPNIRRKTVRLDSELVKEGFFAGQTLPRVIEPALKDVDLASWAERNRTRIRAQMLQYGAVLFRGFDMDAVQFPAVVRAISGDLLQYRERSSPRTEVRDKVYTSTDYPPEYPIFPHNEHSYALTFPTKLYFYCDVPASAGGATPLADIRKVTARIPPEIAAPFQEKGWMYVRNYGDGMNLSWQTTFQTEDRNVVQQFCSANHIEWEWKEQNRLKTRQVRPVLIQHPETGDRLWFNHATFFHVSTLVPEIREALLGQFSETDLPNHTFYGDGTAIPKSVMETLREIYESELVSFAWQCGDLLCLDNLLTAHAREEYRGTRKILVAMAEPYTRTDVGEACPPRA